jgi:hypothetical protein
MIQTNVDGDPDASSTSLELLGLAAFPDPDALFFASLPRNVREPLPWLPKAPSSGFGYPLDGVSFPGPGRHFSTPNALRLRPSELFSFSVISQCFRIDLSAPALFYKTFSSLVPALQRLPPTEKAVPLDCSLKD